MKTSQASCASNLSTHTLESAFRVGSYVTCLSNDWPRSEVRAPKSMSAETSVQAVSPKRGHQEHPSTFNSVVDMGSRRFGHRATLSLVGSHCHMSQKLQERC